MSERMASSNSRRPGMRQDLPVSWIPFFSFNAFHCYISVTPESNLTGSNDPPITGISTRRLGTTDDLDDLTPSKTEITRDGIVTLDSRQLTLFDAIPLQERHLLVAAEQDMFRDEFVMGDIDDEVLFQEGLDDGRQHRRDQLDRGRGHATGRNEDARVVTPFLDMMGKGPHLLDPDGLLVHELHPDGPNRWWGWVWLNRRGGHPVLVQHGLCWTSRETHLLSSGPIRSHVSPSMYTEPLGCK